MNESFKAEIIKSGILHKPLALNHKNSLEEKRKKCVVLKRKSIWSATNQMPVYNKGEGNISIKLEGDEPFIELRGKTVTFCWPDGMSQDGDYAYYGDVHARFEVNEDWEIYDRLRFSICPKCDGTRVVNMNVAVKNEGNIKVPDEYFREGSHVVELENHKWNDCIWEFGSMARDKIVALDFSCRLNGPDTASGDQVVYQIKDIYLEQTEEKCIDKGWEGEKGTVSYATTGYFVKGRKTAVTNRPESIFYIVSDDTGACVYKGNVERVVFKGSSYGILDFSDLCTEGRYHIQIGDYRSEMFCMSEQIYEEATWKVLNFLFCERCGYPVPGKHGMCHIDVVAEHNGKLLSCCGGWHDAGDMSQQMIHTAEVTHAILAMAESVKSKMSSEEDRLLYQRLIEEAVWGLEFILRTRFQDGYRATSSGLVRWTDGYIGNKDDIQARCHNHAFENLLCSAICSYAAKVLEKEDRELAWKCLDVAKEDFNYGMERYKEVGAELPIMWEHTYNSSESLYAAVIVLAASSLFVQTGEALYQKVAAEYGEYLMSCQEKGEKNVPLLGFFYRDDLREEIVHFNHQSREYLYVEALVAMADAGISGTNGNSPEQALQLYGVYLKSLMGYASPYQMFPAGIFSMDEIEHKETFGLLHLLVDYKEQKEHYKEQLLQGEDIGNGYYIKQFPVWFSFRGNTAIHLAMGKAAAILGNYFGDEEYLQMAREQLYWINGKNPFRQSLIYGEGQNYVRQYAVMPGEMMGEMPVGIETYEDEDIPYWPNTNNATYKEVWTSSAGKWLWVLAEIMK